MNSIIFIVLITILIFDYLVERILHLLNAKHRVAALPEEIANIYDKDEYKKQQLYEQANARLSTLSSTISMLFIVLLIVLDGFAYIDSWIYSNFGSADSPLPHIIAGLLFFGILSFASDIISIPFDVYDTFVIEEEFGFNKTTIKTYITDKLKSWLLMIIVGGGILAALLWIINSFGELFWLYAWILLSVIMVGFTMFYSSLIVPLFNKQTPLEDGELKTAIQDFSKKVGFKLDNIFVIDGSKRSTKANAYFSGLGSKKRIVLYDTLIAEMTTEEIVAVLAHEIGHYKKKHTRTMILASLLHTGILLYIAGLLINSPWLTEALGVPYETGKYHIALFAFSILYSPLSFILSIIMNLVSRKNEYEADSYSANNYNGDALITALKTLSKRNLSNLTPHPLYVFFYYSHPTLYQRIKNIKK